MRFIKAGAFTSDKKVEKLTRDFNIHYIACIVSLINLLSTTVDLSFSVHKVKKFSLNSSKGHFEVLVHLLRYIRENRTLGLKYYADTKDALLSDLLRQASINNENQLMAFSDSRWQHFPDTGKSTGGYIIFYEGGPIDHGKHFPGPVAQSSSESEYNAE